MKPAPTAEPGAGPERLLTVADVCTLLRFTRNTVYAMAARREIPHVRIGCSLRFERARVEAWLGDHREGDR